MLDRIDQISVRTMLATRVGAGRRSPSNAFSVFGTYFVGANGQLQTVFDGALDDRPVIISGSWTLGPRVDGTSTSFWRALGDKWQSGPQSRIVDSYFEGTHPRNNLLRF